MSFWRAMPTNYVYLHFFQKKIYLIFYQHGTRVSFYSIAVNYTTDIN